MWTTALGIIGGLGRALVTKAMIEWAVKHIAVSLMEVAVEKYKQSAAKSEDKSDDKIAERLEQGLKQVKTAWHVDEGK